MAEPRDTSSSGIDGGATDAIAAEGAVVIIPGNPSRVLKYRFDTGLYAQRHLAECCFGKFKQFRRVAIR